MADLCRPVLSGCTPKNQELKTKEWCLARAAGAAGKGGSYARRLKHNLCISCHCCILADDPEAGALRQRSPSRGLGMHTGGWAGGRVLLPVLLRPQGSA